MAGENTSISIGAEVVGTDGELGKVSRVIAEARTDTVVELVVHHGGLFSRGERVVPMANVTGVEGGRVMVNLDKAAFDQLNGFAGPIRAGDTDYVGTPGMDLQGTDRGNLQFDAMVATASGAGLGGAGKVLGFPGGERLQPDMMSMPAIDKGTAVLSADGQKVGEVGEFAVAADTGAPTHMTVERGFILKHDTEIPVSWITALSSEGVMLSVLTSEFEAHADATKK